MAKKKSSKKSNSSKKKNSSKSKKKQEETVIHIKFNHPEAIKSKKDLLFAQKEILEILKHVKKYHLLRKKELTLKVKARKRLQEINKDLTHVKKDFPKLKIPDILKEEEKTEEKDKLEKIDHSNIDKELEEIQKKLAKLEQSTQIANNPM